MNSKTTVTGAGETHDRKLDTVWGTAQVIVPGHGPQALSLDIETRLKE